MLGAFLLPGSCGTSPGGAAGPVSLYGNGSQGDVVVTASVQLATLIPSLDFAFRNLTVDPGVTLTVASGTVIRCTGTLTVNGTIIVEAGTLGSFAGGPAGSDPGAGLSRSPAQNGLGNPDGVGGEGGYGLTYYQAAAIYHTGPFGGGGGGGSALSGAGGAGGGAFTALSRGAVSIAGGIYADGEAGRDPAGGGGAGGIVILASGTSINVAGVVAVRGGKGGDAAVANASQTCGAGGGGGGGIVHLVSPTISVGGSLLIGFGLRGFGPSMTFIVVPNRYGGGGGGACGGDGGRGGTGMGPVDAAGSHGFTGVAVQSEADPANFF